MATRCVWCGVVVDTSDRRKMRKHLGEKCKKYPGREEMDCLHKRVIELECIEGELRARVEELEGLLNRFEANWRTQREDEGFGRCVYCGRAVFKNALVKIVHAHDCPVALWDQKKSEEQEE